MDGSIMGAMQGRGDYPMTSTTASVPTMKQRLEFAVQRAETQLAEAKEARDIFTRNPDLERLLDIMQRGQI